MRLANIRRNAAMLESLGLVSPSPIGPPHKSAREKRPSQPRAPPVPAERSSKRLRNESVDGKKLPPKPPPPPTFAAEQAEAVLYAEPFVGTLDAVSHVRDGDAEGHQEMAAARRACLAALSTGGIKQRPGQKSASSESRARAGGKTAPVKAKVAQAARTTSSEWVGGFALTTPNDVVKVVPGRVYSLTLLPQTDVVAIAAGDKYGNVGVSWGPTGVEETTVFEPHVRSVSDMLTRTCSPLVINTGSYDGQVGKRCYCLGIFVVLIWFDFSFN